MQLPRSPAWWQARVWLLLLLPVVFGLTAREYTKLRGPLYLAPNNDPSYIYLTNGALIVDGMRPYHTDHPGTPLQVLCAAVILARHPQSRAVAIDSALKDPEGTLNTVIEALILFAVGGLFLLGLAATHATDRVGWGLLSQASAFYVPECFQAFGKVAPEAFLIGATFAYGGALLWRGRLIVDRRDRWQHGLLCAALAGVCVATKITFAPLALLAFLPWQGPKNALANLGWLLLFVFFSWIPILKSLPRVFHWVVSLATHVGRYGGGPSGFVDVHAYPHAFMAMLGAATALGIIWIGAVAVVALLARARSSPSRATLVWLTGILMAQVLSLAMVAKQPSPHYLQPALATVPLLVAVIGFSIQRTERPWRTVAVLIIASDLALASFAALRAGREKFETTEHVEQAFLSFERESHALSHDGQLIEYYSASSVPYALNFGNGWAYQHFAGQLEKLYPHCICLNIFNGQFDRFDTVVKPEDVFRPGATVYLAGTVDLLAVIRQGGFKIPAGWRIRLVLHRQTSFLFQVRETSRPAESHVDR